MNPILYRLKLVHSRLEAEIRRELKARWPDRDRVTRLKKLKLAIKDLRRIRCQKMQPHSSLRKQNDLPYHLYQI